MDQTAVSVSRSSYAVKGEEMEVEAEAKRVLEQFRAAGKPIGSAFILQNSPP